MAMANLPIYSTSYGETFGYNERDGNNNSIFRNRYLNAGYRGTADLGPVRFNATRAQTTQNLGLVNTTRPQSSYLARTQQAPQQQQQQQQQSPQQTQQFQPQQQTYQQTYQPRQRPATAGPVSSSSSYYQQQPRVLSPRPQQSSWADERVYEEEPRGVYQAPVRARATSASRYGAQPSYEPEISVNDEPYYIPPYERPPSHSYAPEARALGNKTYQFETSDPNYEFSSTFAGRPLEQSRPLQDPGQSIPYGRLQAENAKDVRLKLSLDSWDTFHVADRNSTVKYNLSGLKGKTPLKEDQANFCKDSISRRLEGGAQLRYHLPGYCGFVPMSQFRHGSTHGKTTRQCLSGSQVGL